MTDYHRMEWQARANRVAVAIKILCVFIIAPEIWAVFRYHFPWWDDIMIAFTLGCFLASHFVYKYTAMYRIDL